MKWDKAANTYQGGYVAKAAAITAAIAKTGSPCM
jgi:hypothetical protein